MKSILTLPSLSWNASSSGVLTGFDVCTIAPSLITREEHDRPFRHVRRPQRHDVALLDAARRESRRRAADLLEQRAVGDRAAGQAVRPSRWRRASSLRWRNTCSVRLMFGDGDVRIRTAIRHGGANYSVAMARTLAIVDPGPFGRNSAFRPNHFPLGVSRLPGRDLRGRARPAVVDRVSSRRRHPDHGAPRPAAHRPQRQVAAERRRGRAGRRPQQPGRAARGCAASRTSPRTGCCT